MASKVYVVTGSNKGIGFAIVRALCKQNDGIVYLTARDEGRGLNSVEALKKEGLNPKFHQLDIESVDSIETFRDYLKSTHGGIDVLVNNAAIAFKNNATEPFSEQAEVSCRVNVFATMKFCDEAVAVIETSRKSSQRVQLSRSTKTNIHSSKGWPNSAYSVSKVAVSALSRIQQREMDETRPDDDILVNHVHPGYVDTDMTSHKGHLTIDQGADAPSWLALLPPNTPSNPKGAYVWHDRRIIDWVNGPDPGAY
ncbi:hypothetical protein HA402_014722 [Bradysia odoriphaga]|nr:hypothetical protein HA402_014722 [Bradysia odoriphaga]